MKHIYLDEWCWIALRNCVEGKPEQGNLLAIYNLMQTMVSNGEWSFPLSLWHLIETQNTGAYTNRHSLARIQGELSKGWTVCTYPHIKQYEIPDYMAGRVAMTDRTPVIAQDHTNMFGHTYNDLYITGTDEKTADRIKELYIAMSLQSNRFMDYAKDYVSLNETKESQLEYLKWIKHQTELPGYSFLEFAMENFNHYFNQQEQLLLLTIITSKVSGLPQNDARNVLLGELSKLPSFYVATTLMWELVKEKAVEKLKGNDLLDIIFLSTAIPYCDVVITEKQWVSYSKKHNFDKLYQTKLDTKILDLVPTE